MKVSLGLQINFPIKTSKNIFKIKNFQTQDYFLLEFSLFGSVFIIIH